MEKLEDKTTNGTTRAEYVKLEKNVHLHITDAGESNAELIKFATK